MATVATKNTVLDRQAINRKIRRMVLEIAEANTDEKSIIIAAINGNGEVMAARIMEQLKQVTSLDTRLVVIRMNKKDPVDVMLEPSADVSNNVVLIVDDVANTGRTMMYALKPFLNEKPKKIQTLVLVERSHKMFPIQTDFSGLSIATTLQEHITVETLHGEITEAWLS